MRFRKFICWLIGHSIDPTLCEGWYPCWRCEQTFEKCPREDLWLWLLWYDLKRWIRHGHICRLRGWLRCPDCGGRFGRHDKDRCIPF